jgi:hypothetical protein
MSRDAQNAARDRVQALADDPRYRPFVIGYLLSCLDERHWMALVEAAVEYVAALEAQREELQARSEVLRQERG